MSDFRTAINQLRADYAGLPCDISVDNTAEGSVSGVMMKINDHVVLHIMVLPEFSTVHDVFTDNVVVVPTEVLRTLVSTASHLALDEPTGDER